MANPPQANWGQLFGVGADNLLQYVLPVMVVGELVIPQSFRDEGDGRWRKSLVRQLLTRPPSLFKIRRWAHRFWGREGHVYVSPLSENLYLFQLPGSDSCTWDFENGPWNCDNNPFFVQKWTPVDGLSRVASVLGTPLWMDQATRIGTHIGTVRLCVEMAATSSFPPEF
ncbi:unnamed protein product [Linum trigynum]|uniref:DUF4283 domain-containing protein n=1 Tax=Linum trigynum TaxID=586398 RepID=A0AAV2F750_9ROSI